LQRAVLRGADDLGRQAEEGHLFGLLSYLTAKRARRVINSSSFASDPVQLRLSDSKLRRVCPNLYLSAGLGGFGRCFFLDGLGTREFIRDMLANGDSRAAVVMRDQPLLVACYCDDSDAVCVLQFQPEHVGGVVYRVGDRLLTVLNSIVLDRAALANEVAPDLVQGDMANPRYINFWPLVAEFVSDDTDEIERRKAAISDGEYERCRSLGEEHFRRFPGRVRDGRPDRSRHPAD
jgi:hypothetical protein